MKHIINFLSALLTVVLIGTTFTACSEDDDNGSANIGLGIKAFFPTKVVTNQPITINGSGFNGVTEIEFPGGTKVTNFEIVSNDMIRVNAPAGIPADGGKFIVRTANDEVESRLPLTLGHTVVSGYSKQEGETASGGELITVYGTDLEFINSVELLDADSVTQIIDHKDFYRKGTSTLIFRVPLKNIYSGTFVGTLHTFDGRNFSLPELTYEPAADEGHMEIVKTIYWKNEDPEGNGAVNWSGQYRFGLDGTDGNNECITTFPEDIWNKLKTESFYMKYVPADPSSYQIRVTTGWWSTQWMGADNDIAPWNMAERIIDNGDGTFSIEVFFDNDPIVNVIDVEHILFTGSGYTPLEIYTEEEIWIDGPGQQEVKTYVWQNDGSADAISWSGQCRFALVGHDGNSECIAEIPEDLWQRLKTDTFYLTIEATDPQVRVTTGWWDPSWKVGDIQPGNELLTDNGDGTFTVTVNLSDDPDFVAALDERHLLFTGDRYTLKDIYFIDFVSGGGGAKENVFWQGDGSAGPVSWSGAYRFALEGHDGNNECIGEFPQDIWDKIKTTTFYLVVEAEDPQIRVTTGWWDHSWVAGDLQPGNELLTDNGDGTWTAKINISDDADFVNELDDRHLLFTGDRFTPLRLYFLE